MINFGCIRSQGRRTEALISFPEYTEAESIMNKFGEDCKLSYEERIKFIQSLGIEFPLID